MELQTIYYVATGLLGAGLYHAYNKLKRRRCSQCGAKLWRLSKPYCSPCFTKRAAMRKDKHG